MLYLVSVPLPHSTHELLPLVYAELRKLARGYLRHAKSGATLQPTALIHEAFLHLSNTPQPKWESRTHFLGVAALAMRQVLAHHHRRAQTQKRGGGSISIPITDELAQAGAQELLADYADLDRVLKQLDVEAPELSRVVELRFFGNLSVEETAEFLGISTATVKRHWKLARVWLYRELKHGQA